MAQPFAIATLTPVCRAIAISCMLAASAAAQQQTTLPPVSVTGQVFPTQSDIGGFGNRPLREVPISATVISGDQLEAIGARRLADVTTLDASVTDAYNSPGYWDFLTVRGFTLDNRLNYRREGQSISAETSIPLENKERIEILKGTSGIQAGTSAPGGLVHYVVKRPTDQDLRKVQLEVRERGSVLAALDLGGRTGAQQQWGYRLNVAHETMKPLTRALDGERDLLALAGDLRLGQGHLVEAELEWSHKRQPSQQGFSLLGRQLPAPVDPRVNLNNQPWSLPSVFDGLTGTLRYTQSLSTDWRWSAQWGTQRLHSDDRLAYASGCSSEEAWDRFCADGTFDLYDFRSENERRRRDGVNLTLQGKLQTGAVQHDLRLGLQSTEVTERYQMQAYNWVGIGNVMGSAFTSADPTLSDQSTQRDERSLEFSAQDVMRWGPNFSTWLGLRHTRITRDSVRTNGSRPTHYTDSLSTPFLAASYTVAPGHMLYASAGQGIESQVVPNKTSQYTNAGMVLPALKSRQWEVGYKAGQGALQWQVAWFHIVRPMSNLDACYRLGITPCLGQYDGEARHQGLEAQAQWRSGAWTLGGGLSVIDARRQGSVAEPATNGQRPTNVPTWTLRSMAEYRVAALPGLAVQARLSHEGRRNVLPDASLSLPAWSRMDLALAYDTRVNSHNARWSLGVNNLADKRYWKESPYQYGHVYLFPGSGRRLHINLSIDL